jgi:hypothetical protein
MPRFDGGSEFRKVASHRLRDAQELLQPPTLDPNGGNRSTRHLRGAMYLAGYAVECILKAYLIDMYRPLSTLAQVDAKLRRLDAALPNLLSAEGHRIAVILRHTDLEVYQGDLQRLQFGQIASVWNVEMRYDPSSPARPRAVQHVSVAEDLYNWVNSRF